MYGRSTERVLQIATSGHRVVIAPLIREPVDRCRGDVEIDHPALLQACGLPGRRWCVRTAEAQLRSRITVPPIGRAPDELLRLVIASARVAAAADAYERHGRG